AVGKSAKGAATLAMKLHGALDSLVLDATLSAHDTGVTGLAPLPAAAAHLTAKLHAEPQGAAGFTATAGATANGVRSGLRAADALFARVLAAPAVIRRDLWGVLHLDRLALSGSAATISGDGSFAPASRQVVADLSLAVPDLKPLGALFGRRLAGA